MPKAKLTKAFLRGWTILNMLPRHRTGITAGEIHQNLHDFPGVSKRTIERDLQELASVFPVGLNKKGKPYGWYWDRKRAFDLPGMDIATALSIKLMEQQLKTLLPEQAYTAFQQSFDQADRVLGNASGRGRSADWQNKVAIVPAHYPMQPPDIDAGILQTVQQALIEDRQLQISYRGLVADSAKPQTLHPLGLVQSGVRSYLVANTFDYQEPRQYALHRIESAQLLDEALKRPADFKLSDYIAGGAFQFGSGDTLKLTAWVSDALAQILKETPIAVDMKLELDEEGEGHTLRATVLDSWQLRFWLRSQGTDICVERPAKLRRELAEEYQSLAEWYS